FLGVDREDRIAAGVVEDSQIDAAVCRVAVFGFPKQAWEPLERIFITRADKPTVVCMRRNVLAPQYSIARVEKLEGVEMPLREAAGDEGQKLRQHEVADPGSHGPGPLLLFVSRKGSVREFRRPFETAKVPVRESANHPIAGPLIVATDLPSPEPAAAARGRC